MFEDILQYSHISIFMPFLSFKVFSLDQLKNFLPVHDPISPFTQSIRGLIWIKFHKQLIVSDLAKCSMEYSYRCS